jgi:hypothetical protein
VSDLLDRILKEVADFGVHMSGNDAAIALAQSVDSGSGAPTPGIGRLGSGRNVRLRKAGSPGYRPALDDEMIAQGDTLEAGPDGAELFYFGDTVPTRIGAQSMLQFRPPVQVGPAPRRL